MREFRLSPAAQGDLEAIFDYTVERWGLDQAGLYVQGIEYTCSAMARDPLQGQACDHVRSGYRRAAAGRHYVYFRIESYGIAVIRILHQRMNASRHLQGKSSINAPRTPI